MFAGSTRAPLQIHVGIGIKKACASVLGTNLVEVRLGGGHCGCTHKKHGIQFIVCLVEHLFVVVVQLGNQSVVPSLNTLAKCMQPKLGACQRTTNTCQCLATARQFCTAVRIVARTTVHRIENTGVH